MLISAWLTAVRNRFQAPRVVKRRLNQKQAAQASENLEPRTLLTTTLQAVRPNVSEFLVDGEIRTTAPQELTLQFSLGSSIDVASISDKSIQVFRSGDPNTTVTNGVPNVFNNGNEVPVTIGYVGLGSSPNEVVVRFGETLRDEHYRIVVNGTGTNSLTATVQSGGAPVADPVANATFDFELDLGAQIVAVDPQPVRRLTDGRIVQDRNKIVVYFNDDNLNTTAAQNVNYYQLIATRSTVSSLDDVVHLPTSAVYDATADTVTLTFASDIASLSGAGSYRLRVGNSETIPVAPTAVNPGTDPGSSFGTANTDLGTIPATSNQGRVISGVISPQVVAFQFPGANDEPGHREVEVETHLNGGADTGASGIPLIEYNFQDVYGTDPQGNVLHNLITEAQKDRAREVFAYYSEVAGIDFRETAASGLTIVTGDLRALDPAIPTGPGGVAGLAGGTLAIMDMAEVWGNLPNESWFNVAMHEIGHLLGQGHTYDLPDPTIQGSGSSGSTGTGVEPVYPGDHDVVHMQHMFRPDSIDIDLYRFQTTKTSIFSAEVMAERLADSSTLDSVLRLYRQANGKRELIAQNDNYFSKDSFLELTLAPGVYYVGVSSTGNDAYDPTIANTGIGGTSQGAYDLRVNFRPNVTGSSVALVDRTGRTFDGDNDGQQGGVYNFWFDTASQANTLFVDKAAASFLSTQITATAVQIGVQRVTPYSVNDIIRIDNEQMRITAINTTSRILTVARAQNSTTAASHSLNSPIRKMSATGLNTAPFGFIGDALSIATPGQIVRIVGNGGVDGDSTTLNDSYPYEIGLNSSNQPLTDGAALEVPRGVTVMVDKGAVLKIQRGWLGAGSSTTSVDRSDSALQVLGVPGQQVIMTSWADESIGTDTTSTPTTPKAGDWGGIIFRNEIDRAQNRFNTENEGIFLNYVGYTELLWGGGTVTIDTRTQTINPIHLERSQPAIVNNTVMFSQDSAMSADPDSFEELTFHSPRFQTGKSPFTVDYKRVGPEIHGNTLLSNGNNAINVRIDTVAGGATQKMTVPGRFDDTDIVHLVSQNLVLQGTPGGAYRETIAPAVTLITLTSVTGGSLGAGTYNYRVVFTDENGFESPASAVTGNIVRTTAGSVRLAQLPQVPNGSVYTGRRIYRSSNTGGGTYTLIAELDKSVTSYTDAGVTLTRTLAAVPTGARDRARLDARLSIDPGIIVKLQGARIQAEMGAQLIAEGASGRQVVFTSRLDDRYGAGGTFDTNNDDTAAVESTPSAGNWGGLYIGHLGSASIDRALITFAGGNVPVGGGFAAINPVEIHQAQVRIRNTSFESNADGASSGNRSGLFPNAPGTIFVRGAQPVILDNTFTSNAGAVININVNALNKDFTVDYGRSTGLADLELSYGDNQGPLIRDNVLDSNALNGMIVRGETLTTQSIWDDTDIVHIVQDEIYVPNLHTYGGIRLESSSKQSLVVKLSGATAGFTAGGSTLDITDRIGGMLHIIGQPGQPVVLTSLADDTVGAGFDSQGLLQKDTNGNGPSTATAGDWRGINIDRYSHDRNVAVYVENEIADRLSADTNATPVNAELIGSLAEKQQWADENLRMGVDLQGFIDNAADVDVYSFSGVAGSQIWIDIDRSTHSLDTVVELLDSTGAILAQSDNYLNEKAGGTWSVYTSPTGDVQANGLDYSPYLSDDRYTTNSSDAGMRVVLPGTAGIRGTYFVRVRSSNIDSTTASPRTNLQNSARVTRGLTSGVYQLQVRLQEEDEFAGTTIQYADIRFATTGINISGQPLHSPLTGESEEVEGTVGQLGNLMDTDRAALAVRGTINAVNDVDFYQFTVNYTHTQQIGGVSLTAPHVPVVFDIDYADGLARADLTMAIYDSAGRLILIGRDSNITDDQAGPISGSNTDDLSRGSVGTFDPFVGTVELPGGTYSLAVFNNRQVPAVLDQFFSANSSSPLLRVEPVNSVNRIFEERFTAGDNDTFTTANPPTTNLFNVGAGGAIDPKHVVPYNLGDVVLFASYSTGLKGNDETTIATLNPFTGELVTALGSFGPSVGDIAMRADGELFAFSTSPAGTGESTSGVTGNYLRIDTGTAEITNVGDDGVTTNRDNRDGNGLLTPADNTVTDANAGVIYNAMTFTGTGDKNLFAIGDRANVTPPANSSLVAQYTDNVLYRFDIRTGAVDGVPNARVNDARAYIGAGTTQREIGQVNTAGSVTGMASIANQMFAVDDFGGLYRINLNNANATLVANIGLGFGESFTSLVAGPDEVEGGKYATTMFAMTNFGNLYAFDTAGALAPVFFDGQSMIATGPGFGATGLAFSTLDRNLWATTTNRGTDLGHGVETRFDDSVLSNRQQGGRSLYFGNQRTGASAGNKNNLGATTNGLVRDVNFPGGAQGTVVSNEFSLEGYDRTDKPVLYFNYFLETENAAWNPNTDATTLMRDSFRVFVADESGEWNLVSTNNSFDNSNEFDEFDYGPDGTLTAAPTGQTFPDVVDTFDNTANWRQARIDLSNYAGRENLRLRFDFSTAGSMNLGDTFTTGSELRALDASKLRDGDTFTIDGVVFEFEMGATIVTPSGAAAIGQSFTVGGQTFNFAAAAGGANTIVVARTDSPATVATKAQAVVNAVLGLGSALLPAVAGSNRLTFPGQSVTGAGAALTVDGTAGITFDRAVVITPDMDANAVALVMRQAIADEFSAGDITNIKGSQELVWIIGHDVDNPGPLGFADSLPGDVFGAFNGSFQDGVANRPGSLRGMNNAVEGVYLDDIVLGFAERGEMVINASANQGFRDNLDILDAYPAGNEYLGIDLGGYDLEIRRATDYAETGDASPTNGLFKSIDTNDREAQLASVTLPPASQLVDGSTLTISDGVNQVIFQFLDDRGTTTLMPGAFPIFFSPATGQADHHDGETSISLAAELRDAINSALVQSVLKIKASLSDGVDSGATSTSSQIHLTNNAIVTTSADIAASVVVTQYDAYGDQNHYRDQGQLIIRSSSISNSQQFGIVADAAPRTGGLPTPGSVRNLHTINDEGIVTGVVIMNNVIAANTLGGIRFSGDQGSNPFGPVPYGRIINNTIVGVGSGTGILVEQNASPTLLNNIVADFTTGIDVDGSSSAAGTTIGSTVFRGNTVSSTGGLGAYPILMTNTEPLFVDQANGNYYLAPFSRAIDSSLTSLGDRDSILRIKGPLDLDGADDQGSPIIAPEFDLYGQLRGNDPDVETPAGQGASVLFDRGAIDRVDFFQPKAQLVVPEDQSLIDGDPDIDEIWIDQVQILRQFRVRLIDEGVGVDHKTVNKNQFVLKRIATDGVTEIILVEGVDYQFAYNEVTGEAILTAATFFADENTEVRYILLVDNNGISASDTVNGPRDLAGNYLLPNKADGTTRFDIVLTDGVNDPPQITLPVGATVAEDSSLVFNNQAISIFDQDAHLGTNILTVTLTATNGLMELGSVPVSPTFVLIGNGVRRAVFKFTGKLQELNAAINGLRFIPTKDFYGNAKINIVVDDLGEFSGPPAVSNVDLNITVRPVNDAPVFNPLVNPSAVLEDAGTQTIVGFMTGQAAGPANETPPQTIRTQLTVVSENSAWTTSTFFAMLPTIDPATGTLRYRTAKDVNGTATIRVQVIDSLNLSSVARTFTITVNAVNDAPVYSRNSGVTPIRSDEDSSLANISVDLINVFRAGPTTALDEISTQSLIWSTSGFTRTSGNLVFDVLQIRPDGTLAYRPRKDTAGTATLNINLQDSGLGLAPNDNTAASFSITITINQINDAPVARTGNYTIDEGYSLRLDASSSFDVDAFFGDKLSYAWDLNNDGDFSDPGENAGRNAIRTLTWTQLVALGITAPSTQPIRLRVTDLAGATSIVNATLKTLIVDYGDAPNSYGTVKSADGAAHTITGGLLLGSTRDKETNGQPSGNATGDGTDEDGVAFPTSIERAAGIDLPSYVDVTSTGGGKLDIWLDLNQNGVFDHATEHLNNGVSWTVRSGVNRIYFTIPRGTQIGSTMMRYRLSSAGSLLPTGRASNGEVEDYKVEVKALQAPVTPDIDRPIDFNLTDGLIPQTTDRTPVITWSLHDANYKYEFVVTNAANQIVFTAPQGADLTVTSQVITTALRPGIYTVSLRAFNKAGTNAPPATYKFEVVALQIASPSGGVNTSRPTFTWNDVPGSETYTIQIVSTVSGATVLTRTVDAASLTSPGEYTLPSDLALGQYKARIRATDAEDQPGDWSSYRTFQIRTAPVVTGPVGSVITPRPIISWTPVTGAASYEVELFNLTDNVLAQRVTGVRSTSWSPSFNLSLANYRVVVKAVTSTGFTGFASPAFTFLEAPVPQLIAPNGRIADSTPTFGWNPVSSADLYQLIVRQDFGDFNVVYRRTDLIGTIHTVTMALPLGRYTYTVLAVNQPEAGTGQTTAYSTTSLETTFTVAEPPVVTGPDATTFLSRPVITWTNPPRNGSGVLSDVMIRRVQGSSTVSVLYRGNVSGTSFRVPTDLELGSYVVYVRTHSAVDPATVSQWSIAKSFRVTVVPTLIGPSGRTPDATPTLTWRGVLGGQTYQLEVRSLSKNVVAYNLSGINALSYTIPSDLPIGRYQFRVQARTAFGELSEWSEPTSFQVVAPPVLSGPGASTFDATPSFTWTDMTGFVGGVTSAISSYEFLLDFVPAAGVPDVTYPVVTRTINSYTIPSNLPNGLYRAQVRAKTADTTSDFSTILEFYVGGRPVVNLVNSTGTTTDTTPTISWKPVDGASGYDIFIALASNPNVAIVQRSGIGATSFTTPVVLAKGEYRVWVRAVNAGNGQFSDRSEGAATTFRIVDASDAIEYSFGGNYVLTSNGIGDSEMTSQSTISMLPSVVFGSAQSLNFIAEQTVDSEITVEAGASSMTEPVAVVSEETAPQTDEILSQWDEQKWWDAETVVPAVDAATSIEQGAPNEQNNASVGFLGALLALAPRSLRRRRKEDSST